jgi:hypothetical protein
VANRIVLEIVLGLGIVLEIVLEVVRGMAKRSSAEQLSLAGQQVNTI